MYNWKRVGQRVKNITAGNVDSGREGVITAVGPYKDGNDAFCPRCGRCCSEGDADFFIDYDGLTCDPDGCWCGDWDDVEPIIPDSYKVVEWSSCLWQPSSESINA